MRRRQAEQPQVPPDRRGDGPPQEPTKPHRVAHGAPKPHHADTTQPDERGSTALPHVSVVIPARDCAALLADCLAAVAAQSYLGTLDVTVALAAGSHDSAAVLADCDTGLALRVVDNPAGTTPAGLNAAVAASTGEVIVRVDAQSRIPAHYVAQAVAVLERTGAANVGGVQRPVAATAHSVEQPSATTPNHAREPVVAVVEPASAEAIAAALGSSFGGGPAMYRRASRDGPADTVYLGVFRREALSAVGGFDEALLRNQDYELNWRLRRAGFDVWLDSSLVVDYVSRATFAALSKQFFEYGAWKRVVLLRHPSSLRARQLAAPALIVGLVGSVIALCRGRVRGLALPVVYLISCAVFAARLRAVLPSASDRLRAACAFMVMHLSWGAGFFAGRTRAREHRQ